MIDKFVNQKIFIDEETNLFFNEFGYVVIKNFISNEIMIELSDIHKSLDFKFNTTFNTTNYSEDKALRNKIFKGINDILLGNTKNYLIKYKPISAAFIEKKPSIHSSVGLHADWQVIDEDVFSGINVWIPLQNTNILNGPLMVIPKSHRLVKIYRGPNYIIPQNLLVKKIKVKHYRPLILNACDAVFYDNRLFHYSPPNISLKSRIAISIMMIPEDANLFYFFFDSYNKGFKPQHVRRYDVDDTFYIDNCKYYGKNEVYSIANMGGFSFKDVTEDSQFRIQDTLQLILQNLC